MELKIISFRDIESAISEANAKWEETDKFNTHAHLHEDISAAIPELPGFQHVKPVLSPSWFGNWVSLIMSIHGVTGWHMFNLRRFMTNELIDTYKVWCARGNLRSDTLQELTEMFPNFTTGGSPTESVFQHCQEWFLRLDACSTKDSEGGYSPVRTVSDIINRLCTSARANRALRDILEESRLQEPRIFLVPFNKMMDASYEFRVFCAPPQGKITAISQYRWFSSFPVIEPEEAAKIAMRVYEGSLDIHNRIMKHASQLEDPSILSKMRSEGFTFDVLAAPAAKMLLVEINPFGAMSGCGSCLYHWIKDARLLYGWEDKVEFRIAL